MLFCFVCNRIFCFVSADLGRRRAVLFQSLDAVHIIKDESDYNRRGILHYVLVELVGAGVTAVYTALLGVSYAGVEHTAGALFEIVAFPTDMFFQILPRFY